MNVKEQPQKRKEKKLPVYLTEEEVKSIFNIINSPRDLMLLQTMYYLGSRVNETIHINKSDIIFKEKLVILRAENTKRKKERHQPIPDNFMKPLQQYCDLLGDQATLFPLTKQRVWQIVKFYTKKAGITKQVHPHTFRHSFATQVYIKTDDIKLVQELLGHENLSTTSIYTHLDTETKRKKLGGVFK